MYKAKFTMSDDTEQFEGYTDGSLWNGWANVIFTREQVCDWLDTTPYNYRFLEADTSLNKRDYPVLIIYFEDEELIESSPIPTDDGQILEGYSLNGYEFMQVEA